MLRPDVVSLFNEKEKEETILENEMKNLGGTIYTNAFSVNPDTGRTMACLVTGMLAKKNGCILSGQYPEYFLEQDLYNLNNLVLEKKINSYFLAKQDYTKTGFFPKNTTEIIEINEKQENDYKKQIIKLKEKVNESENLFIFITLSDFHDAMEAYGYEKKIMKKGKEKIGIMLNYIFKEINKDDFDYIFIFSDHGCKLNYEKNKKDLFLINTDRTRITLQIRKKYENGIKKNNYLKSTLDFFPTWCNLFNKDINVDGENLFCDKKDRILTIESTTDFKNPWAQSNLWAGIKENIVLLKNRDNEIILENKIGVFDKKVFLEDNEKNEIYKRLEEETFFYNKNIILDVRNKTKVDENIVRFRYSDGTELNIKLKFHLFLYKIGLFFILKKLKKKLRKE